MLPFIVLAVKTIVDGVPQIVTTIAKVLNVGSPFVRLLFVFLLWRREQQRAAPTVANVSQERLFASSSNV